jgi:hypothetical protein
MQYPKKRPTPDIGKLKARGGLGKGRKKKKHNRI